MTSLNGAWEEAFLNCHCTSCACLRHAPYHACPSVICQMASNAVFTIMPWHDSATPPPTCNPCVLCCLPSHPPSPLPPPPLQGRRDLPQEVIDKHPSLSDPQQTSPASSAALPPLPPISGDMATSDRALTTGSTLEHTQQPLASLSGSGADSTSQLLDAPTTTSPTITTGSPSTGLQGPHSSDNMATSARAATETSSSSKSSSAYTSSVTTTTGRAGPPSLARVSISTISHEALDRTAPGDYHLVTHLGKECATCR